MNFENYEYCVDYIKNNTILPFSAESDNVSFKRIVTYKQKKLMIVDRFITLDEFMSITHGYGGRVGIVPYTMIDNQPYFFIGYSNANLFSDFGGGVKSYETPFEGLKRELSEECCQEWKNYFVNKMISGKLNTKDTIFFNEYIFMDKPNTDKKGVRYKIIILCEIDEKTAQQFKNTKEIVNCDMYDKNRLKAMLYHPSRQWEYINSGLTQLRDYYPELIECM